MFYIQNMLFHVRRKLVLHSKHGLPICRKLVLYPKHALPLLSKLVLHPKHARPICKKPCFTSKTCSSNMLHGDALIEHKSSPFKTRGTDLVGPSGCLTYLHLNLFAYTPASDGRVTKPSPALPLWTSPYYFIFVSALNMCVKRDSVCPIWRCCVHTSSKP